MTNLSSKQSSKQNKSFNKTRRSFLKGAARATALSVAGISSLIFAAKTSSTVENLSVSLIAGDKILGDSDIKIIQETQFDREKVTLINQSGKLQMLDARKPISLHQVNGALIVTVNQNDANAVNGMVLMSPNERFTFDVKAIGIDVAHTTDIPNLTNLSENQLQIISKHSIFNRVVPVQLA